MVSPGRREGGGPHYNRRRLSRPVDRRYDGVTMGLRWGNPHCQRHSRKLYSKTTYYL